MSNNNMLKSKLKVTVFLVSPSRVLSKKTVKFKFQILGELLLKNLTKPYIAQCVFPTVRYKKCEIRPNVRVLMNV